jgi:hypothetical protein
VSETEGAEVWRLLRERCADLVEWRRSDHGAEQSRMEREQLERQREKSGGGNHFQSPMIGVNALL